MEYRDGIFAFMMALGRATTPPPPFGSRYEDDAVEVIG